MFGSNPWTDWLRDPCGGIDAAEEVWIWSWWWHRMPKPKSSQSSSVAWRQQSVAEQAAPTPHSLTDDVHLPQFELLNQLLLQSPVLAGVHSISRRHRHSIRCPSFSSTSSSNLPARETVLGSPTTHPLPPPLGLALAHGQSPLVFGGGQKPQHYTSGARLRDHKMC